MNHQLLLVQIGRLYFQVQESIERRTEQLLLKLFSIQPAVAHGVTITFPNTCRFSIRRSASAASSRGNVAATTAFKAPLCARSTTWVRSSRSQLFDPKILS